MSEVRQLPEWAELLQVRYARLGVADERYRRRYCHAIHIDSNARLLRILEHVRRRSEQ